LKSIDPPPYIIFFISYTAIYLIFSVSEQFPLSKKQARRQRNSFFETSENMPAVPLKLRQQYRHSSDSDKPCAFTQPHGKGLLTIYAFCLPAQEIQMPPDSASVARTNRHFSVTGDSFAFSLIAFDVDYFSAFCGLCQPTMFAQMRTIPVSRVKLWIFCMFTSKFLQISQQAIEKKSE